MAAMGGRPSHRSEGPLRTEQGLAALRAAAAAHLSPAGQQQVAEWASTVDWCLGVGCAAERFSPRR